MDVYNNIFLVASTVCIMFLKRVLDMQSVHNWSSGKERQSTCDSPRLSSSVVEHLVYTYEAWVQSPVWP